MGLLFVTEDQNVVTLVVPMFNKPARVFFHQHTYRYVVVVQGPAATKESGTHQWTDVATHRPAYRPTRSNPNLTMTYLTMT